MAKLVHSRPLAELHFRCGPCAYTFKAPPARVVENLDQEHHPWSYFTACPHCKQAGGNAGGVGAVAAKGLGARNRPEDG